VTVQPGALDHIIVTPSNPSVSVGGTQTYTAQGQDQYNNNINGLSYGWGCSNLTAGSSILLVSLPLAQSQVHTTNVILAASWRQN